MWNASCEGREHTTEGWTWIVKNLKRWTYPRSRPASRKTKKLKAGNGRKALKRAKIAKDSQRWINKEFYRNENKVQRIVEELTGSLKVNDGISAAWPQWRRYAQRECCATISDLSG